MTVPAIHFEAKKHAFRQTQDGVVVSFVIHPNDMNADFAVAPLGTRYMVAVAKIGDAGNRLVRHVPPPPIRDAGGREVKDAVTSLLHRLARGEGGSICGFAFEGGDTFCNTRGHRA